MTECDVLVVGGGPAGLAAAIGAKEAGAGHVLVIDRNPEPGGILNQCVHPGFGLHVFQEELTGPEYADRFIEKAVSAGVDIWTNSMVLELSPDKTAWVARESGYEAIEAKSVVLAMGCRERPRGALGIPGTRPAGIYTAGAAQKLVNTEGRLPGKKIVILGSGDIGLIMARRLTLEGAEVKAVVEIMPYPGGLTRNIVQCLEDYNIPLYLSHTVSEIIGKDRIEGVRIAEVDEKRVPKAGTERLIECDTLLLSAGLIPENELSLQVGIDINPVTGGPIVNQHMETSVPGFFAGGNVLHVHDLVDNVTDESLRAGTNAGLYASGRYPESNGLVPVEPGINVRYVVPGFFAIGGDIKSDASGLYKMLFRIAKPLDQAKITVSDGERVISSITKRYLKPSEMITVTLKAESMRELSTASRLKVDVVETAAAGEVQ